VPEPEAEAESAVVAEAAKAGKAVEQDRQLSKKELKKKELEDMDAILAELGIQIAPANNGGSGPGGAGGGLSKTAQRKLKKQQQQACAPWLCHLCALH